MGEQCDDGNTVGGDCCSATCQFEPSGSPCEDGLVCTSGACDGSGTCVNTPLAPLACPKGYALLEAPGVAMVTARIGSSAQVLGGSACAETLRISRGAVLDGNAVGRPGPIRLGAVALVNGICVTSGGLVLFGSGAQCVAGTDTTGTHGLLTDCQGASDKAEQRRQALLLLPASVTNGAVTVANDTTLDVTPYSTTPGSVVVVDYVSLTLNPGKKLIIQANANTAAVVLRVSGNFRALFTSTLMTQGLTPGPNGLPAERVLLLVGGSADVRMRAVIHGTIFSQGLATVRRSATVHGALVSPASPLRVMPGAVINGAPWVLW